MFLPRPFDKPYMTRGQGQWPRFTRKTGWNQCALLLEKSVFKWYPSSLNFNRADHLCMIYIYAVVVLMSLLQYWFYTLYSTLPPPRGLFWLAEMMKGSRLHIRIIVNVLFGEGSHDQLLPWQIFPFNAFHLEFSLSFHWSCGSLFCCVIPM